MPACLASGRMQRRAALRLVTALSVGACSPAPHETPASPAPGPSPSPSPSATRAALPDEVRHGPRDRPQLALTFHGQGDPALVTALLDELRRGHAPVTVLAVGTWLTANRDLGRRILADGHELGNHT